MAALLACKKRKASGFPGWAFVANQEGHGLAAVDLEVFAVTRRIPLGAAPTAVAASGGQVYALTPENGTVHQIETATLERTKSVRCAERALQLRVAGRKLFVLCTSKLVRLSLNPLQVEWELPLPAVPFDFDLSSDAVAISYGGKGELSVSPLEGRGAVRPFRVSDDIGLVRFRSDGKYLIAADRGKRTLRFHQVATGALVVELPLSVRPDQFCFNRDLGQLFVTGDGMDAVVVIHPYYLPEVAETVLAGHAPGAMAASTNHLLVANPNSGDVSILDINTRRVVAVAPAGTDPSFIAVTPDDQYALVLNQGSGDMAVLRLPTLVRSRARADLKRAALFNLIPVGSRPVSAAIASA